MLSFDSTFYNGFSSWNVTGYQARDQSIPRIQAFFHEGEVTLYRVAQLPSRPFHLCIGSGQGVLLACSLQDASAGAKYSSRKACFSPSSSFFSTSSGRRKLHLESWGKGLQAQRGMREIQIYQMPTWQLLSWAVLKRNYQLKICLCLDTILPMHLLVHHIRVTCTWHDFVKNTREGKKPGWQDLK